MDISAHLLSQFILKPVCSPLNEIGRVVVDNVAVELIEQVGPSGRHGRWDEREDRRDVLETKDQAAGCGDPLIRVEGSDVAVLDRGMSVLYVLLCM